MAIKMGRDEQHGYYIFCALLSSRIYSADLYRSRENEEVLQRVEEEKYILLTIKW